MARKWCSSIPTDLAALAPDGRGHPRFADEDRHERGNGGDRQCHDAAAANQQGARGKGWLVDLSRLPAASHLDNPVGNGFLRGMGAPGFSAGMPTRRSNSTCRTGCSPKPEHRAKQPPTPSRPARSRPFPPSRWASFTSARPIAGSWSGGRLRRLLGTSDVPERRATAAYWPTNRMRFRRRVFQVHHSRGAVSRSHLCPPDRPLTEHHDERRARGWGGACQGSCRLSPVTIPLIDDAAVLAAWRSGDANPDW